MGEEAEGCGEGVWEERCEGVERRGVGVDVGEDVADGGGWAGAWRGRGVVV